LRDAVDRAIEEGSAAAPGFVSDGEGYCIFVLQNPAMEEDEKKWLKLRAPYSADYLQDCVGYDGDDPSKLMTTERYKELYEKLWKSEPSES
tara:strand:+ start:3950 stop:4222 length:273 start_codon:yes stop_codon:yes gene_type:complete